MKKFILLLTFILIVSISFAQKGWKFIEMDDVNDPEDYKMAWTAGVKIDNLDDFVELFIADSPQGLVFMVDGLARGAKMGSVYLNFEYEDKDWFFGTRIPSGTSLWILKLKTDSMRRAAAARTLSDKELIERLMKGGYLRITAITLGGYHHYLFDVSDFDKVLEFFENYKH